MRTGSACHIPSYRRSTGRVAAHTVAAGTLSLVLMLTLAACSIHIGSSASAAGSSKNGTTVPVRIVYGQNGATLVLLPVIINGHGPYTFALDTGASTSLIDQPLAQKLNLPQNGTPQPISGVSGNELAVPVHISSWSVGNTAKAKATIALPPSTVSSANLFASQRDSGLQGLVGSDIWTQFGKITIDYHAQTLTVYKQFSGVSGGGSARLARILARNAMLPRRAQERPAA